MKIDTKKTCNAMGEDSLCECSEHTKTCIVEKVLVKAGRIAVPIIAAKVCPPIATAKLI